MRLFWNLLAFGALTAGTQAEEIKLKPKPVGDVNSVIAPSDNSGGMIHFYRGVVLPGRSLQLKSGETKLLAVEGGNTGIKLVGTTPHVITNGKLGQSLKFKNNEPLVKVRGANGSVLVALTFQWGNRSRQRIYYRGGERLMGKVSGKSLYLYDDNLNGRVDGEDAFAFVNSPVFAPLSEKIGGPKGVFKVSFDDEKARSIQLERLNDPTISFSVKHRSKNKLKPYLAYRCEEQDLNVVCNSKASMKVLSGKYQLIYGLLFDKKKMVCAIKPGDLEPVEAKPGKSLKVKLGGSLKVTFEPKLAKGKVKISPRSLKVTGKAGEQYVGAVIKGKPKVYVMAGKKPVELGAFGFG